MAHVPGWVRRFMSLTDLEAVRAAVAEAERGTGGEIRVHLDPSCAIDPMERAVEVFEGLGMHRTAERTGVLVYVAIEDRQLAVVGDAGVNVCVPPGYWDRLRDGLVANLRAGRPRDGLVAAVREVGEVLRRHFPRRPDDDNELRDEVSLG